MRSGRKPETVVERRARQQFTETILERGTCEIQTLIPHVCGGGHMDACHVLAKQFIRIETNTWTPEDRAAAMWDTDNGLLGCRVGHNLFDAIGHGIGVAELPEKAVAFAERYGWLWRLELEYPERLAA